MNRRYSVILGNLGNTKDRFCGGYKDNPDTLTMLERAAGIPHVTGIELVGTWDIWPGNVTEIAIALQHAKLECVSIIPDLFANPIFGRGSFTSKDPGIRQQAVAYTKEMAAIAQRLNCSLLNLWPGQDGYDYLLACDYDAARTHLMEGIAEVAAAFSTIRIALEYKPKEPRVRSFIARMADTLLLCEEINRSTENDNVGVCIDTGHAFVAGESVGEAIVLAKRAGNRLFHMHFNDNHGAWDDDLIVGTVHHTAFTETLYWLDRTGYDGWLSMDQYPYREDAAGAIGESIAWLVACDQRVVSPHREEIGALLAQQDAVATARFLRTVGFGSGDRR